MTKSAKKNTVAIKCKDKREFHGMVYDKQSLKIVITFNIYQ